jgi:hypothetical protein
MLFLSWQARMADTAIMHWSVQNNMGYFALFDCLMPGEELKCLGEHFYLAVLPEGMQLD